MDFLLCRDDLVCRFSRSDSATRGHYTRIVPDLWLISQLFITRNDRSFEKWKASCPASTLMTFTSTFNADWQIMVCCQQSLFDWPNPILDEAWDEFEGTDTWKWFCKWVALHHAALRVYLISVQVEGLLASSIKQMQRNSRRQVFLSQAWPEEWCEVLPSV